MKSYAVTPKFHNFFSSGNHVNGPYKSLPDELKAFINNDNILSLLVFPIFMKNQYWGMVSILNCTEERYYSDDEENILLSAALMIASTVERSNMISEIKRQDEELHKANQAKSEFLAKMSHEIRTPMNVVLGVAESYLGKDELSSDVKEGFEKIYNAGDLLLRIINDILDMSKIEAGKFELAPEEYEIVSFINDVTQESVVRYEHKAIDFKLKVDENTPTHLYGDKLRIRQILNNILSNAFKYTDTGEVSLAISFENIVENTDGESSGVLVFAVHDTGQGMNEEQISHLFDEYTRFNLSANRNIVGTGLGMAITNNLLKMMGGHLDVESAPDKGSTFTARIPQGIKNNKVLGNELAENLQRFRFRKKVQVRGASIKRSLMPYGKILVVDDMVSNLDVAVLLTKPYCLQIDTALSGFEAIEKVKCGQEYDIIFMDHMMPKMDGIAATRQIRELNYQLPIVALTANAIVGQADLFLDNGFDGFISKPIDIRQLDDLLNRLVRDKHKESTGES
jgi:signal transduction histidine kinase/CheY-like chemotaxis protein